MTEELIYDPKTKQIIKDKLFNFLYDPVNRNFDKRLKTIIVKNSQLHRNDQYWLSYKGINYAVNKESPMPRPMNRLKAELRPIMDDYIADQAYINEKELPYIIGFINQALNSSNSIQDYFQIFPQSIHKPLKTLIESCGCRKQYLEHDSVEAIKQRNLIPIELMKKRMVLNLLI